MPKPESITMTMRELDRCKVIEAVVDDGLMVWCAAEKLGISKRQVERLVQRLQIDGSDHAWFEDRAPDAAIRQGDVPAGQIQAH
ncbi:helix-turn-helix domain-containing protein [Ralstonia pseudosolanacearum]|uniref:helix-turn-helix domain-containing protein n=1 Tax=Ralstonia pseudosolanacearum TaxID=1310165 RepID=UPI002687DFF2|nr:helix-turn-helix domain-containing protein [Ralstonia pseudosolanacearum]